MTKEELDEIRKKYQDGMEICNEDARLMLAEITILQADIKELVRDVIKRAKEIDRFREALAQCIVRLKFTETHGNYEHTITLNNAFQALFGTTYVVKEKTANTLEGKLLAEEIGKHGEAATYIFSVEDFRGIKMPMTNGKITTDIVRLLEVAMSELRMMSREFCKDENCFQSHFRRINQIFAEGEDKP